MPPSSLRARGLLERVSVRIGDRVRAGQLLGQVDTARLKHQIAEADARRRGARASRERVNAELVAARAAYQRSVPWLERKLISPQDQETLRARVAALEAERDIAAAQADEAQARKLHLRQQIEDARMIALFDGAVAERHLDAGAVVQPGTAVLTLVKSGPLARVFAFRSATSAAFAVPFGFTGVLLALLMTSTTFNLYSFLGTIVLVGIAVNNAIVLIDYANVLRREQFKLGKHSVEGDRQRFARGPPVAPKTVGPGDFGLYAK